MSLQVKEITFRYSKEGPAVLEAFSASFEKGEITGVMGPNGAGKTTLSKIIMGIIKPQDGSILIDNLNMADMTLAERGRYIGYVMQNPARQIFSTTVKAEMEYGLQNLGMEENQINKRVEAYLQYFDLSDHAETFPFFLSHGEKQRLVLAAILSMKPDYLMLDEPTASLDVKRRALLGSYLLQIKEETGCGIIIISHDQHFMDQYADVIVEMGHV